MLGFFNIRSAVLLWTLGSSSRNLQTRHETWSPNIPVPFKYRPKARAKSTEATEILLRLAPVAVTLGERLLFSRRRAAGSGAGVRESAMRTVSVVGQAFRRGGLAF